MLQLLFSVNLLCETLFAFLDCKTKQIHLIAALLEHNKYSLSNISFFMRYLMVVNITYYRTVIPIYANEFRITFFRNTRKAKNNYYTCIPGTCEMFL